MFQHHLFLVLSIHTVLLFLNVPGVSMKLGQQFLVVILPFLIRP